MHLLQFIHISDFISKRSRKSTRSTKKSNSILSTTTDEYLSASNYDSSDLEFYDVSDDDIDGNVKHLDLVRGCFFR